MTHLYNDPRIPEKERIDDPLTYLSNLIKAYLNVEKWGFIESSRLFNISPKIIYDSEWCRIKFVLDKWDLYSGFSILILYGRLHAPDEDRLFNWNGEQCHCWHRKMGIGSVMDFLDGISPVESLSSNHIPAIVNQVKQTEWWKSKINKRQGPELALRMEAEIWDYYGIRLFELFDLRHPDLWVAYQKYMKSIYDIQGRIPEIKPPLDMIC
jgi:hypothetical protein